MNRACSTASKQSSLIPSSMDPQYITSFKYPVKGGKLYGHVDKKKGWVVLYSLGQSCKFFVKNKATKSKKTFSFKSGDCLIFDSSQQAKISHGMYISRFFQ